MPAQKGFTLIELMVVISIIAILSVIGLTVFQGAQKSARDAKRKGDLHAISIALEQYKTVKILNSMMMVLPVVLAIPALMHIIIEVIPG